MTVTTTPGIDGRTIGSYLGIVTGEAIVGANIFQDLFANIRDIVGGRSAAYEQELARARTIALEELQAAAQQLGADAVVGVDLDYEVLGANNGMLMVSVSGTAVKLHVTRSRSSSRQSVSDGPRHEGDGWRSRCDSPSADGEPAVVRR